MFKKTLKQQRILGNSQETVYTLRKSGKNKDIEVNEIKGILTSIQKLQLEGEKIRIRGKNALQTWTLKGYSGDLDIDTYEDYFEGKVADSKKFNKFYELEFTVSKNLI